MLPKLLKQLGLRSNAREASEGIKPLREVSLIKIDADSRGYQFGRRSRNSHKINTSEATRGPKITEHSLPRVIGLPCRWLKDSGVVLLSAENRGVILFGDGSVYGGAFVMRDGDRPSIVIHGTGLFYDSLDDSIYVGAFYCGLRHGIGKVSTRRFLPSRKGPTSNLWVYLQLIRSSSNMSVEDALVQYEGTWDMGVLRTSRRVIRGVGLGRDTLTMVEEYGTTGELISGQIDSVGFDDQGSELYSSEEQIDIQIETGPIECDTFARWLRSYHCENIAAAVERRGLTAAAVVAQGSDVLSPSYLKSVWGIKPFGERMTFIRLLNHFSLERLAKEATHHTSSDLSSQDAPNRHRSSLPPEPSATSSAFLLADEASLAPGFINRIPACDARVMEILDCDDCGHRAHASVDYGGHHFERDPATGLVLCENCGGVIRRYMGKWLGTDVFFNFILGRPKDRDVWQRTLQRIGRIRYPHLLLIVGYIQFSPEIHATVSEWLDGCMMDEIMSTVEIPPSGAVYRKWDSMSEPEPAACSEWAGWEKFVPSAPPVAVLPAVEPPKNAPVIVPNWARFAPRRSSNLDTFLLGFAASELGLDREENVDLEFIIVHLLTQVALTFTYLHELGIVHGNLSLRHILLADNGHIKVCGYENSLLEGIVVSGGLRGPPLQYAFLSPPEYVRRVFLDQLKCAGDRQATPPWFRDPTEDEFSTDIYHYGWIAWQMMTWRNNPFDCHANIKHSHQSMWSGLWTNKKQPTATCPSWMEDDVQRGRMSFHQGLIGVGLGVIRPPPLGVSRDITELIMSCTSPIVRQRPPFPRICRALRKIQLSVRNRGPERITAFLLGEELGSMRSNSTRLTEHRVDGSYRFDTNRFLSIDQLAPAPWSQRSDH